MLVDFCCIHFGCVFVFSDETLLRLEATSAKLQHVLQVLEEESDLIGGLETWAALPPTCKGTGSTNGPLSSECSTIGIYKISCIV